MKQSDLLRKIADMIDKDQLAISGIRQVGNIPFNSLQTLLDDQIMLSRSGYPEIEFSLDLIFTKRNSEVLNLLLKLYEVE